MIINFVSKMKTETIDKYLRFLSNLAYKACNDLPDSQNLEQIQNEHSLFIRKLKESTSVDKSFINDLDEIDLCYDIKTAETTRGFFKPLSAILPIGTGGIVKGFSKELVKEKLYEYHHQLMNVAEKHNYGPWFD